jgi:hypothetical protein
VTADPKLPFAAQATLLSARVEYNDNYKLNIQINVKILIFLAICCGMNSYVMLYTAVLRRCMGEGRVGLWTGRRSPQRNAGASSPSSIMAALFFVFSEIIHPCLIRHEAAVLQYHAQLEYKEMITLPYM